LKDKKGKLHNYVNVNINGKDAYPNEMDKEVKPGDEVHVLYTMVGDRGMNEKTTRQRFRLNNN
jgi:hypothetical protein